MSVTKIEWSEVTWNPTTGCTSPKESAKLGCFNCYARLLAERLKAMGQEKYKNGFSVIRILQEDIYYNIYDWLSELIYNIDKLIESKLVCNIFICKNNEYAHFNNI